MSPINLSIFQALRAGHVRRWHIVAVAREQTIADHMWRVQTITFHILKMLGHGSVDSNLHVNAMEWARIHDTPEVVMGDIPTNAKKIISDWGDRMIPNPVTECERQLDDYWRMVHDTIEKGGQCPEAGDIVKIADLAEAANYCKIFGLGAHAKLVHEGIMDDLAKHVASFVDKHLAKVAYLEPENSAKDAAATSDLAERLRSTVYAIAQGGTDQ